MRVTVIASPLLLRPEHLAGNVVVVIDVLRATTTMTMALQNGCSEIRIFKEVEDARLAAAGFNGPKLLCGERFARPPVGFDLGNSPGDFTAEACGGKTLFMSTTNGTFAITAARTASLVLTAALINREQVVQTLNRLQRDTVLLCAGQRGDVAMEDLLAAGAILLGLNPVTRANDACFLAAELWERHKGSVGRFFRQCHGARTELLPTLEADIDFCAQIDLAPLVGCVDLPTLAVRKLV